MAGRLTILAMADRGRELQTLGGEMKRLAHLAIFFSILASPAMGADYFVSPNGDDNADGLTPETAWKTASKVNQSTFQPGDNILFERGGEWREQLKPNSSGTAESKITFGAYGDVSKAKPTFLGSQVIQQGSLVAGTGSVYSMTVSNSIGSIWQDGEFYRSAYLDIGRLTSAPLLRNYVAATPNSWAQIGNEVIFNTGGVDPNASSSKWTMQVTGDAVYASNISNVTFTDLRTDETAMWNMGYGFRAEGTDGVSFLNCDAYNAGKHHFGIINSTNFLGENLYTSSVMPNLGAGNSSAYVAYSDLNRSGDTYVFRNVTTENNDGQMAFYTHGQGVGSILLDNLVATGAGIGISAEISSQQVIIEGGRITDGIVTLRANGVMVDGIFLEGRSRIDNYGNGTIVQNSIIDAIAEGFAGAIINRGQDAIFRFNTIDVTSNGNMDYAAFTMIGSTAEFYGNIALSDLVAVQFFGPVVPANFLADNVYAPGSIFRISGSTIDWDAWQSFGFDSGTLFLDPQLDGFFIPNVPVEYTGVLDVPGVDYYGQIRSGGATIGAVQAVPEASALALGTVSTLFAVCLYRRNRRKCEVEG